MMNATITVINKSTHESSVASGLHALIVEPSVVQVTVNNASDIAGFDRQGNALVIMMKSGEFITVDDFYLLHKGHKNTLVIQDAHGLSTPALDAGGLPVLSEGGFVKIESIEPLLDSASSGFNGWWLAGAGLLAGGVALAAGGGSGGGGGGGGASTQVAPPHPPYHGSCNHAS